MRWSFSIGTVAGTQIRIHITFLLLLGWYGWTAAQTGGPRAGWLAVGFLLALFLCVLLHEFGHIAMARKYGVRTPEVILSPIGGVARLERMPDEPRQEFFIALAGPLVTALIAGLFYLILAIQDRATGPQILAGSALPFLPGLMWVNLYLLVFNLIPAFPMDGGRVLRSILAKKLGMVRGTRIAARTGQGFAIVLGLAGLAGGSPILVLIAGFIFLGAQMESTAVETRAAGRGIKASQMMVTDFRVLRIHATLRDAALALLSGEQREFPVVDNLGRLEGLLTRDHLIRGLTERGPDSGVTLSMAAVPNLVDPDSPFESALEQLQSSGLPALPVVTAQGQLVGLITKDNITDLLLVRRASGLYGALCG